MTTIQTYKGAEITVNAAGRFEATTNGRQWAIHD